MDYAHTHMGHPVLVCSHSSGGVHEEMPETQYAAILLHTSCSATSIEGPNTSAFIIYTLIAGPLQHPF